MKFGNLKFKCFYTQRMASYILIWDIPPSTLEQCPHSLRETNFKENNAISHLTDDNIILYPLLPSDTLDQ